MSTHDRPIHRVDKIPPGADTPLDGPTEIIFHLDAAALISLIGALGLVLRHPDLPEYFGHKIKGMLNEYIDAVHLLDPAVWDPPIPAEVWEEWQRWRAATTLPLK